MDKDQIENAHVQAGSATLAGVRAGAPACSESETDRALAEIMIAHHEEAIAYADKLLACSSDAYLCWLAETGTETRRRDIVSLRHWIEQQATGH